MYKVYGIPNCDTVKKATTWLKTNGVDFEFHNYKTDGITKEKIEEWLKFFPLDRVVNKASTTYKGLSDEEKEALSTAETAIPIIIANTSLIKRPVIEDQKIEMLGFDATKYSEFFKD